MQRISFVKLSFLVLCIFFGCGLVAAQTTTFTYQGKLSDMSVPANGQYDFTFRLFDAATDGVQIGNGAACNGVVSGGADAFCDNIEVTNGIFTVNLNFGSGAFADGGLRFLEISVRPGTSTGGFTPLTPRQQVTSSPFSIKSSSATTADNSLQLGGVAANQYVLTTDSRLSDDRNPLPNSPNYIQNRTTPQPNSSFFITQSGNIGGALRIEGNGFILPNTPILSLSSSGIFQIDAPFTPRGRFVVLENGNVGIGNGAPTEKLQVAGNVSAAQYNIGGSRILGNTGTDNLFAGINAGAANTGNSNSFFGRSAGTNNTTGSNNSFVGLNAGASNTTGIYNSFFGSSAGTSNTTGGFNLFVGALTGGGNTTGDNNSFVGYGAGFGNTTGNNITLIGSNASVGSGALSFATAIGANSTVQSSNTIALGRSNGNDTVRAYGLVELYSLGEAGFTQLCRNFFLEISTCSSSLRYKINIMPFSNGLSLINQLRPISFDWKDGGMKDVGFGAEDVARINSLFVNYNDKGEVEGVKYDRLSVVFVNAFKEQQAQLETQIKQIAEQNETIKQQAEKLERQQTEIERQKARLEALKQIVCETKPEAAICKEEQK